MKNFICFYCNKEFNSIKGMKYHIWRMHTDSGKNFQPSVGHIPWNKGLTKKTSQKVAEYAKKQSITLKTTKPPHTKNKQYSEEEKKKMSLTMKQIHANGNHPGWSHINSDKTRRSYPEKFFFQILENNRIFKKYKIIEKMPFGKYFLDFAFVDIKLDVEIDGVQHYRNNSAIQHDKKRDEFLINKGWKVYRIVWKEMYINTKIEITKFLDFLNNII